MSCPNWLKAAVMPSRSALSGGCWTAVANGGKGPARAPVVLSECFILIEPEPECVSVWYTSSPLVPFVFGLGAILVCSRLAVYAAYVEPRKNKVGCSIRDEPKPVHGM